LNAKLDKIDYVKPSQDQKIVTDPNVRRSSTRRVRLDRDIIAALICSTPFGNGYGPGDDADTGKLGSMQGKLAVGLGVGAILADTMSNFSSNMVDENGNILGDVNIYIVKNDGKNKSWSLTIVRGDMTKEEGEINSKIVVLDEDQARAFMKEYLKLAAPDNKKVKAVENALEMY